MRIGITDSGVGGLSVCAEVEAGLRASPVSEDIEILYLNAALRDDYSYNSMSTRGQKLESFDRFLENVARNYRPDLLFIACNTLSILFDDPRFDRHRQRLEVQGIVESATRAVTAAWDPADAVIVFATPTTVDEGTYARRLKHHGIPPDRIVQQACPGLPDAISNDFSGGQARELLQAFVPAALARFDARPDRVIALLGCTHYGYQAELFEELLLNETERVRVLNPNRAAAGNILDGLEMNPGHGALDIRFVTPYAVPEKPLASLTHYLGERAPLTVAALHGCFQDPGLYGR